MDFDSEFGRLFNLKQTKIEYKGKNFWENLSKILHKL